MKLFEKSEEAEKDKEVNESASPDTTSQHKNHLFDLNCKICIGNFEKHVRINTSSLYNGFQSQIVVYLKSVNKCGFFFFP